MRYPNKMIFIHWLVVAFVLVAYITGGNPVKHGFQGDIHVTSGLVVAGLFLIRIPMRLFYQRHIPQFNLPTWQARLAHIIQGLLYLCMMLIPLTGMLALSEITPQYVLWGVNLPMFPYFDIELGDIHEFLAQTFIILAGLHAGAALIHHFIWEDEVLTSMLPRKDKM